MKRRHGLAFVFVTSLLDSIGFGIIMPVLPQLLMEVTGAGLSSAALHAGWLIAAYAGMQFLAAPILGQLSDRFGRRPVLLLSLAVLAVNNAIMYLAPTFAWLMFGRVMAGAAASTFSTCNAYVADISEPDERTQNFGLIGAAFGMGFVIGPVLGGFLGEYGPRAPFLAAGAFALANFLYGLFGLPESLPEERRRPFELRRANPVGTLVALRRYPVVFGVIGAYVLFQLGHQALPTVWSYFALERFGWSPLEIGYSLGVVGVLMVFVQTVLLRAALPKLGSRRAAVVGYLCLTTAFLGYAFATQGWMIYLFLVGGALQGFIGPAMQGIMSNQVGESEQGELQGGLASMSSLTAIVSPPFMMALFAAFTGPTAPVYFAGAPWLAAAVLTVLALMVFLRATVSLEPVEATERPA